MSKGKAEGVDGLSIDLIKVAGDFLLDKLAVLFTKCLETSSVLSSWKNVIIVFIYKKGDIKDLTNYHPISLQSVVCNFFLIPNCP